MSKRQARTLDALCGMLLLVLVPVPAASDPVYRPAPIAVPAGMSKEAVKTILHKALLDKDWQVKHHRIGHMEAMRAVSGKENALHVAVIGITYDERAVRIEYKDSKGMGYEQGRNEISAIYANWVKTLEKSLKKALRNR